MIISSYAPPLLGGPQNMYNLLYKADPSSYCILTSFYNIDNVSAKIGTWLPGEYIFYDKLGDSYPNLERNKAVYHNPISFKRKIIEKLKYLVKRNKIVKQLICINIILGQIMAIVHAGKKAIKNKNIDSMIAISDYGPAMIGTYILHKITGKTYSIFLFDLYRWNNLPFPGKQLARLFEASMFCNATHIVVTNNGTKDFYKEKYEKNITDKMVVIHNSTFKKEETMNREVNAPKKFFDVMFTGRIYWPQVEPLQKLIKAIHKIKDLDVRLKIYSPNPKDYLEKIGIKEDDKVSIDIASPKDITKIQSRADILFLPLSFHGESMEIINTATPGKLSDYLIAGRPILIHAPASTYVVKYARENNFAAIADEDNIESIIDAIRKILTDKSFANTIVKNAKETFDRNHDAEKNSAIFMKLFGIKSINS